MIPPTESLPTTRSARLLSGRARKYYASRKRVDFDEDDLVSYTNTLSLNSSTGSIDHNKFSSWNEVDVPIMKKLVRRTSRLEKAMQELGDNYLGFVSKKVAVKERRITDETDVDNASITSTSDDSSKLSETKTFVEFDESLASGVFVHVYPDVYPGGNPKNVDAYDSDVPQKLNESDFSSDSSLSESEYVESNSGSSCIDTRETDLVLTSSPRINTADYPESAASLSAASPDISSASVEVICGTERGSLPSYSAAVASGVYLGYGSGQPSPGSYPEISLLDFREAPFASSSSGFSFPVRRLIKDEEVELNLDARSMSASASHDTSTSFTDSSCSSSEGLASESDDSDDSDDDDDDDFSHSDDDDDESQGRDDSDSNASQGPRYTFDDSIDGNTTESGESDDSASEANSDDRYRVLLATIANFEPEDLVPMGGESGYSSSSSSSCYDNSYGYRSDSNNGAAQVSRPPSSSYDYYDQLSFISSAAPPSLDTNMREELGITVGHVNVVDHSNSSEERLGSSLSQFNETGSRGSVLGNLHLGRDLWSELSRSPPLPKSPSPLPLREVLSAHVKEKPVLPATVPVTVPIVPTVPITMPVAEPLVEPVTVQKFKWAVPPAAPFPKPRLTFEEPPIEASCESPKVSPKSSPSPMVIPKEYVRPEEVIKVPRPVEVEPPLPFPHAPAMSVSYTEASESMSYDYFPSTVVSCDDPRLLGDTLTLGMTSSLRVSRRVSFTHSRLRLDVWNSMADILCGHDLPDGSHSEMMAVEKLENQIMTEFLSDPVDSDYLGLSTSSVEIDLRDIEASDLDEEHMLRLRRYSLTETNFETEHSEEIAISPHSHYALASSTAFSSSDYNSSGLTPTPDTSPQDFLPIDDEVMKIPLVCPTALSPETSSGQLVSDSMPECSDSAFPDGSPKSQDDSSVGVVQCDSGSASCPLGLSELPVDAVASVGLPSTGNISGTCSSNLPTTAEASAPLSTSTRTYATGTDTSSSWYYTSSADVSGSPALSSSVGQDSSSCAMSASVDSKPTCSPLMVFNPSPECASTPAIPPRLRGISLYSPTLVSPESEVDEKAQEVVDISDAASIVTGAATVDILSDASSTLEKKRKPGVIALLSPAPFPSRRVPSPGMVSIVPYQQPSVPFVPSTEGRKEIAAMATNLQSELASYFDTPKNYKGQMVLCDAPVGVGQPTSGTSNVTDENVMVLSGSAGVNVVGDSSNLDSGSASTRESRRSRRLKSAGDTSPRLLVSLKERVKRSFKSDSKMRKNELEDLAAAAAGLNFKSPTWKSPSWKSPSFKSPSWKSPSHHNSGETIKRHTISKFFTRSRDATLRD